MRKDTENWYTQQENKYGILHHVLKAQSHHFLKAKFHLNFSGWKSRSSSKYTKNSDISSYLKKKKVFINQPKLQKNLLGSIKGCTPNGINIPKKLTKETNRNQTQNTHVSMPWVLWTANKSVLVQKYILKGNGTETATASQNMDH